jgi:heat shock protein HslJ
MKTRLTILLLLFLSFAFSQRMIFYVADTKGDCYGVAKGLCLQVKEKPDEPYALFYSGIEGFSYEEGYHYKLEVMRVKRERPPADGSAYNYYLINIISKERSKNYTLKNTPIPDMRSLSLVRISKSGKMEMVDNNAIPSISFDKKNGRISGKAGCNRYFGKVSFDQQRISISGVGSTQMACSDMEIESLYLKHLTAVNRYQLSGNNLQLFRDQELLLQFIVPEN